MSQSDRNRHHGSPRPSGLNLSTGRLEGRPASSADTRRTRHNPLRESGRDTRDDRRPGRTSNDGPSGHRHSGRSQAAYADGKRPTPPQYRSSERNGRDAGRSSEHKGRDAGRTADGTFKHNASRGPERNGMRDAERSSTRAQRQSGKSRGGAQHVASSLAGSLLSFIPSTRKTSGHGGSFRRGIDLRTLALGLVAFALAIVLIMAIAHVGPFAPPRVDDATQHVGALSAMAVQNNGATVAQDVATQISLARPIEPDLAKLPAHTVTREDITSLGAQKEPYAFSLAGSSEGENGGNAEAPVLSDRSLVSLNNALVYFDTNGYNVGYLLMDLGTGRGIAGNLDATVYGASSFKGPYCTYVAQNELPSDIDDVRSSRREQIENIILWSDNTSYGRLRSTFGDDGMAEWLADAGVDTSLLNDTYYPHYTARQSALMWLKIYTYLGTADSSVAQWLSDTFSNTEVSFLRNGALGTTSAGSTDYIPSEDTDNGSEEESTAEGEGSEEAADASGEGSEESSPASSEEAEGSDDAASEEAAGSTAEESAPEADTAIASIGTNITVRNKAGWINVEDLDAVCDSGIVTINGRDYLMTIMTGSPDTAEGERAFAHLARTLLEVRSDLA